MTNKPKRASELDPWDLELGRRLRMVREGRDLSLAAVTAIAAGFGPGTIGTYERGERKVSARKLQQLANLYEVPVASLFPAPREPVDE